VGGLTVVRALRAALPAEDILYLGDTARLPYGSKSSETVARYSLACAHFLAGHGVKALLIACNTASAHALPILRASFDAPVLGAVEPGARTARAATRSGHVGVIGTLGTVRSGAYEAALRALGVSAVTQAAPLLVPLAEEGWTEGDVPHAVAVRYLRELQARDPLVDTLVLGCTHYPLLVGVLQRAADEVFAHRVTLVDSATAMEQSARETLASQQALADPARTGTLRGWVTDASRLDELAPRFLGEAIAPFATLDLGL
jgi:glutamate racemase